MADNDIAPLLPEVIETQRLVLRPYLFEDVDAVLSTAADEEWGRYLAQVPYPYTRADAVEFIARTVLLDRCAEPAWAITLDDAVVGGVDIRFVDEHRLAEMGWSITTPLWGQGLCTEAAQAVVDASFTTRPDLNRIRARADARNVGSHRVAHKIGMRSEGTLRQNEINRGTPIDECWFGILRSEWEDPV